MTDDKTSPHYGDPLAYDPDVIRDRAVEADASERKQDLPLDPEGITALLDDMLTREFRFTYEYRARWRDPEGIEPPGRWSNALSYRPRPSPHIEVAGW